MGQFSSDPGTFAAIFDLNVHRWERERLRYSQVKEKLRRVVDQTPVNLFDAKPYVDYQRQKYFAAKLGYEEPENLHWVRPVTDVGISRLEGEKSPRPNSTKPCDQESSDQSDNTSPVQPFFAQTDKSQSLTNVLE